MKKRLISVVTGVYNEEKIVQDVYSGIKNQMIKLKNYNYEHLFLDNCSEDKTLAILKKIAAKDKHVKILSYSKNFGPIKSGFVGLKYATGDAVIYYEANMKDPIPLIPTFIKHWEDGYELVYGVRQQTSDSYLLGSMRRIYYRFVNALSDEELPPYFGGFGLVGRILAHGPS